MSETLFIPQGGSGGGGGAGPEGPRGFSVLHGAGAPAAGLGANEEFYIDTTAHTIYGPKTAGAWGSPTSLVGPTGSTGPTGLTGEKGLTGNQGPEGVAGKSFVWRGAWKAATAYALNDVVSVGGSSYICIKAMTVGEDVTPPNGTFWELLAEKGEAGGAAEVVMKAIEALNGFITNTSVRVGVLNGLIYINGLMTINTEVPAKSNLFTLPVGARPEKEQRIAFWPTTLSVSYPCNVKTNGEVENIVAVKITGPPVGTSAVIALK